MIMALNKKKIKPKIKMDHNIDKLSEAQLVKWLLRSLLAVYLTQ